MSISVSDEQIKAHLIQKGLVSALRFEKVWKNYQSGNKALLKLLTGTLCSVDAEGVLVFRRFPGNELLFKIPLLKPEQRLTPAPDAPEKPWEWAYLDSNDGNLLQEKTLPAETPLSLLITRQGCFLHYPGFEKDDFLGMTSVLPDHPSLPEHPRDHFDLYVSPDRYYLLASHRESGELTLISLEQLTRLKSMHLGNGSQKALNVAFDITRRSVFKAYITDNQSQYMYVVDLANMHASPWASGMGVLGNLQMTRDKLKLFLITHQPQISLKYLDKEQLKPLSTLKTKGMSQCLEGNQPQDLMILAQGPEVPYLMLLTYMQELGGLPVVQVIDAHETKTLKRYSLKNLKAPDMLLTGMVNPVQENAVGSLEQLLYEEELMTPEQWESLIADLEAQYKAGTLEKIWTPPLDADDDAETETGSADSASVDDQAPEPLEQDPEIFELIDKDGDPIVLPLEVNEAIFRLLIWYFYQATLTNLEVHGPELYKLRKVAAKTRKRLERKLAVMVSIPAILGKYTLELPISRKMVFRFLEQLRRNKAQSYQLNLCPVCHTVMINESGCPLCPECGMFLDSPIEKKWRRQASAEHSSFLPAGQMLFPLRAAQRLLVMTPWHQPLFIFDTAAVGIRHLGDAVVLPNLNFLLTDTLSRKISEYSSTGHLVWSSRLTLKQPVTCTLYQTEEYEERFLIVDKGLKQVLEINRKSQLLRAYPERPDRPDGLIEPTDIQRTPEDHWLILDAGARQVLEINTLGETIASWGPEQGLSNPIFARRLPSGETLIVDTSEARILTFAADGSQQCYSYWPPATPSVFSSRPAPEKAMRLHNGELLLVGQGFYLLANPVKQTSRGPLPLAEDLDASKTLLRLQISASERSIDKQQQIIEHSLFLKSVEMLAETTEKQRMMIAEPLTSMRFRAGETIITDLGQSGALYFIVSGTVDIIKQDILIKSLEKGEVFGEIGLVLATGKLDVSVQARTACQLFQLERNAFKKVILRFPRFFHLVRALASERQTQLRRYQDEKSQAMTDKLAHRLMVTKVSQHPLFSNKGSSFHEALAHYLKPVAFMPNQILFTRGEVASNLYIINEGSVGILRRGEQQPVIQLGDGDLIGEMAFFSQASRSATVTTLDYCKMYELEYQDLHTLLGKQIWLKAKLEKLAKERAEQNTVDLAAFEEQMGIKRQDLPRTQAWSLMELQEDQLVFFATTTMDLLLGVESSGEILWCAGKEPELKFSCVTRLLQRQHEVYISDTGNNRIVRLELSGRRILQSWQNQTHPLNQPRSAWVTSDQLLLVADEANSRLVMLDQNDQEVWEYGPPNEIMNPFYAEETDKGTILFADAGLHKVYEISREGEILWSYGRLMIAGDGAGELTEPAYAHRLESGETLIADQGNDRLVVVSRLGRENALYYGTSAQPLVQPHHCEVRENGDVVVLSASENKVLRLDHWGEPIWSLELSPAPVVKPVVPLAAPAPVTMSAEEAALLAVSEEEALAIDEEDLAVPDAEGQAMSEQMPATLPATDTSAPVAAPTDLADTLGSALAEALSAPLASQTDSQTDKQDPAVADPGPGLAAAVADSVDELAAELLAPSPSAEPELVQPVQEEAAALAEESEPVKKIVLKPRWELLQLEEEDDVIEDF